MGILIYLALIGLIQSCYGGTGDLRFFNGQTKYSGVVQMQFNGTWETICNDTWTVENTEVACKQLGYLGGAGMESDALDADEAASTSIYMKKVNCTGDEWTLQECSHQTLMKGCEHDQDVSIACIPPGVVSCVTTEGGAAPFVGKLEAMNNLSSGPCLDSCRAAGFAFASLDTANQCSCGAVTEAIQEEEKIPFDNCRETRCPGNEQESCGGDGNALVFDVRAGNCGGRLEGNEGSLSSPGFPNKYQPGLTCIWELDLSNPDTKLSILGISLAEGDQIKLVFPEDDDDNVVIAHSEVKSHVTTTEATKVRVTFSSSDASTGGEGFFLIYQDDTQCKIPDIENGSLVYEPGMVYRPGSVLRMRCDLELVHSNATVLCKEDGEWFPVPSCGVYVGGLSLDFVRTILVMVIVGLIALGILFALTTIMLICIKANDKRQSGYQGITTEIVEAPQSDSIQEEHYTTINKDDIKVQLHSPDEDMDNNANEQQVIPAAEEDMDLDSPLEEASPADETVEADESMA